MTRFEYLVVYVEHDRVLTANGHWQGAEERGADGDLESCPTLFDYLAEAGAQGWDLVALDPEDKNTSRLFFKRMRIG